MTSPKDQTMDYVKVVDAKFGDKIHVIGCCLEQNPCSANIEDNDYIRYWCCGMFDIQKIKNHDKYVCGYHCCGHFVCKFKCCY
jgi:hypothetical protein